MLWRGLTRARGRRVQALDTGYGFPSNEGDRSTCGRVTAGQYRAGMCDCTGRRLCGAYGRTPPAPLGIRGARRRIQALWRTGRKRPPGTSRRNTATEQGDPIATVSAVRDALGRNVTHQSQKACPMMRVVLPTSVPRPSGVASKSCQQLPPRLRLQADIFIGGRVDIVRDQAQAGDRHPGAGDTQEAQLPERHEGGVVIHLLLNLV